MHKCLWYGLGAGCLDVLYRQALGLEEALANTRSVKKKQAAAYR